MKFNFSNCKTHKNTRLNLIFKFFIVTMLLLAITSDTFAQSNDSKTSKEENKPEAKVIGLNYICVHVLELEKTMTLYREILGFKLADAEVYHGPGLEGMLVMKMRINDLQIHLSVTAPEFQHTIGPVGNTNHNHFMLKVNDISTIGDKLKEQGYALENENYKRDKYTFFVGPNGEIIGLSEWD